MVQFFLTPKGPSGQKTLFKKSTFCNFWSFLGLTSNAIFSVICPCRIVFNTILENYKEMSFQKWFLILSHILEVVTKCIKKTIFASFLAQLLYVIFSVICLCRKLFNTILWVDGGPKGPQWGPKGPPMWARRAPNVGPKGPPMPSAGARRKGP